MLMIVNVSNYVRLDKKINFNFYPWSSVAEDIYM